MYDVSDAVRHFARNLRFVRELTGMSQTSFAESLFVARSSYSDYERGLRFPDVSVIMLICERYGLNINTIIYGTRAQLETDFFKTEELYEDSSLMIEMYDMLDPYLKGIVIEHTFNLLENHAYSSILKKEKEHLPLPRILASHFHMSGMISEDSGAGSANGYDGSDIHAESDPDDLLAPYDEDSCRELLKTVRRLKTRVRPK